MSVIKAGYRVTVTSWENDADYYRTESSLGLTKEEAQRDVEFLKLIKGSHCNNNKVFGNLYEPRDSEVEAFSAAVKPLMDKYEVEYDPEYPLDVFIDIVSEYTGYSEGYTTRNVESIIVEYIPEDIHIEDVSKEFGV